MKQNLLAFKAEDGFVVNAHMMTGDYEEREDILDVPILLQVHGLLGHFLARGTPRLLPHALLDRGYNSLSINTRLAFAGQINGTGIFDDTLYDLDAAVEFLTEEGFRNIFILGYSLGANMTVHWASKRPQTVVKGLMLEGPLYSMPDSHKRELSRWGSHPTYDEIVERARIVLGDDPCRSRNDETFVMYRSRGSTRQPGHSEIFTYKTWWFMVGPEACGNMTYRHIGRVKLPILLLRGENDGLTQPWEPEALGRLAREAGNDKIRVRQLPDAGHDCMENPDEFLKEIAAVLETYSIPNGG